MKGLFTLGIYIAIGITGAAFGQSSDNVKTIKTDPVPHHCGAAPAND